MDTDKRRYKTGFQISDFRFQTLKKSASICVHLWLIFLCVFAPLRETSAQVRPVYDYGANGLAQLLKRLNTTKSVLMIGAHPDDEDSALLAFLARGENARTAYLSLTRGDGGQNIIGSELFESLGIIRTEELLQARRLDGAQQFFTRAFDFGFTKTLAETKQKWDERIILCDTVRVIRSFRPLVVISRFAGTTADGHGQHQYSGYISPLAVRAAADATQCTDAGAPWQVLKFYVEQGFRDTKQPTLKINTGAYDSLLGRSFFEIAMEGRSQHRTQEQGGLELKGDQFSGLNLIESRLPKVENESGVFDDIDTQITEIPKQAGLSDKQMTGKLSEIQNFAERALREYSPNSPQKIVPLLIKALLTFEQAKKTAEIMKLPRASSLNSSDGSSNYSYKYLNVIEILQQKEDEFSAAWRMALGIKIDCLADKETVVSGEPFKVIVNVFYPNEKKHSDEIDLKAPSGWEISKSDAPKEINQTFTRREAANQTVYFNVKVSKEANLTEPYWLESPRTSDLFTWQTDGNQNLPFQKPLIFAELKMKICDSTGFIDNVGCGGTEIIFRQSVQFRYADSVRGEVRRELNVVPKISLSLDQKLLIVPKTGKAQIKRVFLNIVNNSSSAVGGEAKLNVPNGWKIAPNAANFHLKNKGEKTSAAFDLTIPADTKISDFSISAQAEADGETFNQTLDEITFPHIQTHRFYTDAKTKVDVLDLKVAPVKVGYIMGSGDAVPDAIRQMGLTVDLLNESDLEKDDLTKYDTIVVGIRAYQVRRDLIANNKRVLDFAQNGGTLIVQYQRPDYVAQNLQPFPASQTDTQKTTAGTTARVVDENARVTILQPGNTIFNFPNKITDKDFDGWVQERNLYNFTTFDEKYTPLLEAHDAGELENKGGMVSAKIGRGNYVYTSYSFFRQLPAGVPGAYRLFANLLALPKTGKR